MKVGRGAENYGVSVRRSDQKGVAGLCDKLGVVDEIRRFAFFEKHEFPHGVRVRSVGRCVLSAQKVFVEHHFFEFGSHFLTLNYFCFIIADFFCLVNDLEIKAKKSC